MTHSAENDAAAWRPVPGHAPTETADIFGGYLCECGASWSWLHDAQVRQCHGPACSCHGPIETRTHECPRQSTCVTPPEKRKES